jgi:large subunit ribosomal protein L22
MQVKAKLNYLRIAPRKVRLVTSLIRKKKVEEARAILNFTVKKASEPLLNLLNSAVANAKNNLQLDPGNLYIFKITVDEGRKYKRWMARSRGRASQILKKTSNITIILDEIKPGKKAEKLKKAVAEPVKEEKKPVKTEIKKPKPRPVAEKHKPKPGFIKKIFRRKSI